MRIETNDWTIAGASKMGLDHLSIRQNCHDAYTFGAEKDVVFGAVLDGCGSGNHSEVGAKLTASYMGKVMPELLRRGKFLPDELFRLIVSFVKRNVALFDDGLEVWTMDDQAACINDYWLFTVLGFVVEPELTRVFYAGDGTYDVNDVITHISSPGNAPQYIAYNCISDRSLLYDPNIVPSSFVICEFPTKEVQRISVATDGFHSKQEWVKQFNSKTGRFETQRDEQNNPVVLPPIEQCWGLKGNVGLNKFLNKKSDMGYFTDDCAIVTAERKG